GSTNGCYKRMDVFYRIIAKEFYESTANNCSLGVFSCLIESCAVFDSKPNDLRIFQIHITYTFEILFLVVAKSRLTSRNTGTTYHINKAVGNRINKTDTFIRCLWRY